MADKHKHDHHHGHEHVHHRHDDTAIPPEELDAAGKSLSDALRISFVIMKVIMIVLVVAFLASGFRTVGPDEKALVLRFGQIQRTLEPGLEWIMPYPIDELVKIPVERKVNLGVNTFWYRQTRDDILGEGPKPRRNVPPKLNPLQEGYCLTGSQQQASRGVPGLPAGQLSDSDGSDYNIVHTKWQIIYQIGSIEQFFKNVYVKDVKPGQVYFDIMSESITPLLRSVIEDAVVTVMVHYSIDEALQSTDTIPGRVRQLVQRKLDDVESGIRVASVQLVDVEWPKQVNDAFEAFITASQTSQKMISEARTYAENTVNEAAGRTARPLYEALHDETLSDEQRDQLWAQVAGEAQNRIAEAQAYRTMVVEAAKANANYLTSILPEYRKRPRLVAQRIYLDAIEAVLMQAEEKFILQPSSDAAHQEIRVLVNRDPSAKNKAGR